MRAVATRTVLVVLLGVAAGCRDGAADTTGGTTLEVLAAASLTSTFTELAEEFEADHEGVEVRVTFAGSSDLVAQIQEGAPADVYASADTATMDRLGNDAPDPQVFATNRLEIAVPPDNPAGVASLADLAQPAVDLVVCAPEVPCGAAARQVAAAAGLTFDPVSEEQAVTDVLGKVVEGEADAGLVYVTDVQAAGDAVRGVEFPESAQAVNRYPVAALAGAESPGLAEEFVALVLGATGRQVLGDAGFGLP